MVTVLEALENEFVAVTVTVKVPVGPVGVPLMVAEAFDPARKASPAGSVPVSLSVGVGEPVAGTVIVSGLRWEATQSARSARGDGTDRDRHPGKQRLHRGDRVKVALAPPATRTVPPERRVAVAS